MAYPTLPTAYGSDPKPINGLSIDRAEDGTGRVRSFQSVDRADIPLTHRITAAQKSTLDAYYSANRLLTFDYVSPPDGLLRTCVFSGAPSYRLYYDGRYEAKVTLAQA